MQCEALAITKANGELVTIVANMRKEALEVVVDFVGSERPLSYWLLGIIIKYYIHFRVFDVDFFRYNKLQRAARGVGEVVF